MKKFLIGILSFVSMVATALGIVATKTDAKADEIALAASTETVYMSYYGQYTFGNGVISNANISSDITFYCDGVHYKGLRNVFGSVNYTLYFVKDDDTQVKVYECGIYSTTGTWVNTKYKTIYSVSEGTPTNMSFFQMTRTAPTLNATYSGNKVSWTAVPYAAKYYVYNNAGTKVAETTSNSTTVNTCGTYYVTAISSSSRQIVQSVDRTLSHSYTKKAIKGRGENIVSGNINVCTDRVTAYYLCANCDAIGTSTFTYREAGTHTYGSWQTVTAATCTTAGSKKRECTTCGVSETGTIAATGHSYGSWQTVTAATCTGAGSRKKTCATCKDVVTESIAATGHDFSKKVNTLSDIASGDIHDCTSEVKMYYRCKNCDLQGTNMYVYRAAGTHTYGSWQTVTAATCTSDGQKTRQCKNCSAGSESQVIPALGHNYSSWQTSTAATCTTPGTMARECANCSDRQTSSIPPKGHDFSKKTNTLSDIASGDIHDCTSEVKMYYRCKNCDLQGTNTYVYRAAGEHDFGYWIIDTPAGCFTHGSMHRECANCSATITQDLPAAGRHDFTGRVADKQYLVEGERDCQHPTLMYYSCTVCGAVDYNNTWIYEQAAPHEWDIYKQDPTCTEPGVEQKYCKVCAVSDYRNELPALGHNYVDHVCIRCGDEVQGVIVTFYDHDLTVMHMDSCEVGATINLPAKPIRKGYDFVGWYYYDAEGEYVRFDQFTRIEEDTDVYAYYDPVYVTIVITDTVTKKSSEVKILKGYTLSEGYKTPKHSGYNFVKFTRDGANILWSTNTPITETVYLTAHYDKTFFGQIGDFFSGLSIWVIVIGAVGVVAVILITKQGKRSGSSRRRRRR